MTKSKFKKFIMTSFRWHHRYYVTAKRHNIFQFWAHPNQNFWLR